MFALLFGLICSAAWIGDDSVITARTVKNFLNGYGLRYNLEDRVQTYTNPLLMLTLSAVSFFTREFYYSLLFLNLTATAAALFLFYFKQPKTPQIAVFCSVFLILSAAFKDYASSGLENSFSYLLSAAFFLNFFAPKRKVPLLTLLTGLILLNRMDTVLLVFPAWLYACAAAENKRQLPKIVPLCLSPFIAWEAFCLIYYGFLFPNTAYAKLNADIPLSEYLRHGIDYYKFTFKLDFATLAGIGAGLFVLFKPPFDAKRSCAGLGVVLYLLYILYIGGDFMSGRFFAVPLFVCVFVFPYCVAEMPWKNVCLFGILLFFATKLLFDLQPVKSKCFHPWTKDFDCVSLSNGIGQEKNAWAGFSKRWFTEKASDFPHTPIDLFVRESDDTFVFLSAGIVALSKPPQIRAIDVFGLSDVLISRMPAVKPNGWRTGHIFRLFPKGYLENRIKNKQIADYSEKIKTVVSDDLFSVRRFKAVWDVNTHPLSLKTLESRPPSADETRFFAPIDYRSVHKFDFDEFERFLKDFDIPFENMPTLLFKLQSPAHQSRLLWKTTHRTPVPDCSLRFSFVNSASGKRTDITVQNSDSVDVSLPADIVREGYDLIMVAFTDKAFPSENIGPSDFLFLNQIALTD